MVSGFTVSIKSKSEQGWVGQFYSFKLGVVPSISKTSFDIMAQKLAVVSG